MDDFSGRSQVPAFGSWDCSAYHDLPFTQCFDSARRPGFLRYSYTEDRDLFVAGDLYENDVVTPTMIVVPRRRGKARYPRGKESKEGGWVGCDIVKEPTSPASPPPQPRKAPKAVDEDLYRISPELLHAKYKRKGGFFSSCLLPSCAS